MSVLTSRLRAFVGLGLRAPPQQPQSARPSLLPPPARLSAHLGDANAISNHLLLSGLRNTVRPGNTAWKDERYALLQEALWEDFELEDRYDELARKLAYITDSIRYALDVAHGNKSIQLERLIVLLISAELALSLLNADFGLLERAAGLLR